MHKTNTKNPVFYHKLDAMNALFKIVPAGMTGYLQPMDLYANGIIKTGSGTRGKVRVRRVLCKRLEHFFFCVVFFKI